ncbi:MAG: SRPBCC family protein [Myxococcales bacterium]|nr:SRPBCC family protein [Myxococcales bacterium]
MTIALVVIGVIALGVATVLFSASQKPDTFRYERRTLVNAPPDRVHGLVDDFNAWRDWSPWEGMDPAMNRQFSGTKRGVGAVYEWNGNKKVGRGRMEILDSVSPGHVFIKLDFFSPFEAHNRAEFTFRAVGNQTEVVWAMTGPQPFMSKVMTVVLNLEKLVGKDFEKGLVQLKAKAES